MRYINHVFKIKSQGEIECVDTKEKVIAHNLHIVRQLSECAVSALLPYDDDPLYLEVSAILVNVDGERDIFFTDSNYEVEGFFFTWGFEKTEKIYYCTVDSVELQSLHEYVPG